ncbi:MAG TPA: hypothetical protein VJ001_14640 [Rhodocyclaceae bacterium]|nr:hypothetical protein [Rhodocyclaceae bacterium]
MKIPLTFVSDPITIAVIAAGDVVRVKLPVSSLQLCKHRPHGGLFNEVYPPSACSDETCQLVQFKPTGESMKSAMPTVDCECRSLPSFAYEIKDYGSEMEAPFSRLMKRVKWRHVNGEDQVYRCEQCGCMWQVTSHQVYAYYDWGVVDLHRIEPSAGGNLVASLPLGVPVRLNIASLGQIFTPAPLVDAMLALRRNCCRVLEPCCGNGAFYGKLTGSVAIEVDAAIAPAGCLIQDFFDFPESDENRFETVIGSPPYVFAKNIHYQTRTLLRSERLGEGANLYLFFIEKAVRHLAPGGELIFLTPRAFLQDRQSAKLNQWLYRVGSVTDVIDLGDTWMPAKNVPDYLVWRFEKDCTDRTTRYAKIDGKGALEEALCSLEWQTRTFTSQGGRLTFAF